MNRLIYYFLILYCLFSLQACEKQPNKEVYGCSTKLHLSKSADSIYRKLKKIENSNVPLLNKYGKEILAIKNDTNAQVLGEFYVKLSNYYADACIQNIDSLNKFYLKLKSDEYNFMRFQIDIIIAQYFTYINSFPSNTVRSDEQLNYIWNPKYVIERTCISNIDERSLEESDSRLRIKQIQGIAKILNETPWDIYHSKLYTAIGDSYLDLGNRKKAKSYYSYALKMNLKNNLQFEVANVLNDYIYSLEDSDSQTALKYGKWLVKIINESGYKTWVFRNYKTLGHCYFNLKDFENAKNCYYHAYESIHDMGTNTYKAQMLGYYGYSIYRSDTTKIENYKKAIKAVKKGIAICDENNYHSKDILYLRVLYIERSHNPKGYDTTINATVRKYHELSRDYEYKYRQIFNQGKITAKAKELEIGVLRETEKENYSLIFRQKLLLILVILCLGFLMMLLYFYRLRLTLQENINKKNVIIESQNNELNSLVTLLKVSNENLEHFAQIVAHDIKTPLHSIRWGIDMFKSRLEKHMKREDFEMMHYIKSSCTNLMELLTSLLQFSTITQNLPSATKVELELVIKNVISNYRVMAMENKVKFICPEILPCVEAHEPLIQQLFLNIISNSIKFIRAGEIPVISIEYSSYSPTRYAFMITDNGTGINYAQHEKVFNLFERLNRADDDEGSGIGLAMCKKIVDFYSCNIWISSSSENGTSISFTLPKCQKTEDYR